MKLNNNSIKITIRDLILLVMFWGIGDNLIAGTQNNKSKPISEIAEISNAIAEICTKTMPAVVSIIVTPKFAPEISEDFGRDFFGDFFGQDKPKKMQSLGSGFIIKSSEKYAFIVTNYHVIANSKKITVVLHNKREINAVMHAFDVRTDIAILKIDTSDLPQNLHKLPCLKWGDSKKIRAGELVVAIGNSFGFGSTVTLGVISSINRDLTNISNGGYVDSFIQHSAQINMGNSGGCLINVDGDVIGINSSIFSPSGGNVGIGFAIPADIAQKTVDQLIEFKRTKRGWIGVKVQCLTQEMADSLNIKSKGYLVSSVNKDSPAQKAGIKNGDVILEFDSKPMNESNSLIRMVGESSIGKSYDLKINRDGKEIKIDVTIAEFTTEGKQGNLEEEYSYQSKSTTLEVAGLKIGEISKDIIDRNKQYDDLKGVVVLSVDQSSNAAESGILKGDVIIAAKLGSKQTDIKTVQDFYSCVKSLLQGKQSNMLLLIMRNGEMRYLVLKINENDKNDED